MSHAYALQIDNVGNYLYLNNGRFKFEVDPHQFNLRLHHFSQFQLKRNQKLAGLWLADEMVDHIGIYESKVAEGSWAFQRRSCFDKQPSNRSLYWIPSVTLPTTSPALQELLPCECVIDNYFI